MEVFELEGRLSVPGIDKVGKQLDGLQGKVQKMAKGFRIAGAAMTAMGGAMLAGFGVSMKAAADFESAMREVNTMMGLSQTEFKDFSKEVQTLAADLGVDAVDSANALYQAISAGVPKENVLEFLEVATKAAIGGITDTVTAVDGLTTVLNAFKLPISEAQKVADIMFTTVKGGKTTFEELSASLFQVAPIAAASGVKFEEVAAALATMTKQGVPTSVATTQLRQAMVSLQKPTKEMAEVINSLGYESGQVMMQELGLADTLNILRDASGGSNEMLMKMFGSVEAGQAVLSLTGDNAAMFAEDLEAMKDSAGAATDAFEEMEQSTSRQMNKLKASFKDVMITVGTTLLPVLSSLVEKIKPVIESVRKWMEENPGLTKTIILAVGALAGLMVVLGPILMMLPGIVAALPILGGAFMVLLGPVGLIIAAIAGLIAIGVLIWKNWDVISAKAQEIWGGIVRFFEGIPDKIGQAFSNLADIMLAPFRAVWEGIETAVNWLIDLLNKISFTLPDWLGGKELGINIAKVKLLKFGGGGLITEPTLLYGLRSQRPYAIAGESGVERVVPGASGGDTIYNVSFPGAVIREEADLHRLSELVSRELHILQESKSRARGI